MSPKGLSGQGDWARLLGAKNPPRISGFITSSDGYENKNLSIDRNILNLLFASSS
jgi:hypothetical protein